MRAITGTNEYIADEFPKGYGPPLRKFNDKKQAEADLKNFLQKRTTAVLEEFPGTPVVLLSGGIDSIAILAALAETIGEENFLALTVACGGAEAADYKRSIEITKYLGVEHEIIDLSLKEVEASAKEMIQILGISEILHISSAIPYKACFDSIMEKNITCGPVFTGSGADVLLAGGKRLAAIDLEKESAQIELKEMVWQDVNQSFTYNRLIPDFYERILGEEAERIIHFFRSQAAWEITNIYSPQVIYEERKGIIFDKAPLRRAATSFNVPEKFAWTEKEILQNSSGVIPALTKLAEQESITLPWGSEKDLGKYPLAQFYLNNLDQKF